MPRFKPFRHQNHARAIPSDQFKPIRPFRPEDENVAAIRICVQSFCHKRYEAMNPFAKIDRLRGDQNLEIGTNRYHGARRSYANTNLNVSLSARDETLMSAPSISISIIPPCDKRADFSSLLGFGIVTGTKTGGTKLG